MDFIRLLIEYNLNLHFHAKKSKPTISNYHSLVHSKVLWMFHLCWVQHDYLVCIYCISETILSALGYQLITILCGKYYYYLDLMDKETEIGVKHLA